MIFLGTYPIVQPDGRIRCRIRNRPGVWVIMDPNNAQWIRRYDLFMDHTKRVWAQGITGTRIDLAERCEYVIESNIRR